MDIKIGNKSGQIAIFVIVAVMIAAVILVLFVFDRKPSVAYGQDFDNPESYIDNCVKERAQDILDEMLPRAGFIDGNDTVMYNNVLVTYLCKNIRYYEPCINQYPRYIITLQKELEKQISNDVLQCFAALEQELTRRNYAIDGRDISIEAEFKPDVVELKVLRDFTISKDGFARSFDLFDIYVSHPVYELAFIANEIVAQEARWCYFNNDGFMAVYPKFSVWRDRLSDSTKIYTVTDKDTQKSLTMAIRGCAIPAGF